MVNHDSLLVAPLALGGAPSFELSNRAATPVAEEQHGSAVGRRHTAELGAKALVVWVVPALAALPRQRLDLAPHGCVGAGAGTNGLLGLQLDIELQRDGDVVTEEREEEEEEEDAGRIAAAPVAAAVEAAER